ncbi:MAG: S8 family serine peptidase [Deltaproteobacteria bacterium]|nr:S8 family serine peptidase [Deltaproteobacteria bacterium]
MRQTTSRLLARALALLTLSFWGCGAADDDGGGGDDSGVPVDGGGSEDGGGPPADGRLPGAPGDSARGAIDFWEVTEPQTIDVNPELEGLLTSATRALAAVTEDATVGDVNGALDAAGMRIVGGLPGGIIVADIAEPDFAALRAAVQTLAGSGAFRTAGEDLATVSEIVPPDSESFADSGQAEPWTWDWLPAGANWHLEWVRAPAVWSLVRVLERRRCGRLDPVVGVVDAGMHPHADLTRVAWEYAEDTWIPGDPNEGDHALAVSGMIAAGTPANDDRGIEGVNPWASIVGRGVPEVDLADGAAALFIGTAARVVATTSTLQQGVAGLLASNPGLRIVNLSHNWPWAEVGYNPDLRNRILVDAAVDSGALETLAFIEGLVADGHDFVLFQSAGNDRDDFGGSMTAHFGSPFAAAALDLGGAAAAHVLVIEAIGQEGNYGWDTSLSAFSQSAGDLSAPGERLGIIRSPGPYAVKQGTSFAAPLAAGVASLVTMFDPDIGSAEIIDVLRRSTSPTGGGARPGVSALGAVLALDGDAACGTWKKALVDVDDGTVHGLQRWTFDDSGAGRIDVGDSGPDGAVDMADFRAFRTAYDHYYTGLGPADHPKLDLNRNGRTWDTHQDEEHQARFDFNGDGQIETVVGADAQPLLGERTSDLDLLLACFTDDGEGWTAEDLRGDLIFSADLLFRLQWVTAEVNGHLSYRSEDLELDAIELRWPTGDGTHSVRLEVPLPDELLMTVPLFGGPLEVVAIAGDREVCTELAPAIGDLESSDHVVVPIHVTCAAGETCCDDGCHDLRWDADNCGDCGAACAGDDVCDDGRCRPAGTCGPIEEPIDCDLPEGRCCDGACYPPTDQLTCEGCDSPCDWNETCCAFTCCPHGETCCPGDPTQCCAWGEDVCSGARLDVSSDPLNCGGCANACPDGWECCHGACVNTSMDRVNCGGCDVGCMPSEACCEGACTSMTPETSCGGCPGVDGQDCTLLDTGCCNARICGTEGCPATCTEEWEGLTCDPVTGQYFDLARGDAGHCGAFGEVCGAPARCVAGQCVLPEDDNDSENCYWTGLACAAEVPVCCEGRCTDLDSDRENCGDCGHACPFGFDWSCCDGVCVDTTTDHDNCWTCGQACADDEQCCNGQCSDVSADVVNCGQCGYHCPQTLPLRPWEEVDWTDPWPQPVPACCDSQCPADTPAYDEDNCGGCGIQCEEGQTCCAGSCVDALTDEENCGFCHNQCAEDEGCCGGRCRDLLTDRQNCGECDNPCGLFESCAGGGCICEVI